MNEILIFFSLSLTFYSLCINAKDNLINLFIFSFYRYDDVRSPLPQSISQMSLYNNNNNTSGNVYQQSGIIEPLPFHHNHRPVPIPPSTRSLISDYNPTCELLISASSSLWWLIDSLCSLANWLFFHFLLHYSIWELGWQHTNETTAK